jgi:hypothetical protein
LRETVKQRMGIDFLIANAVSDIPLHVMKQIKKEAFDKYLPNDRRPIKAWGLAMASLRCLKRDLVKNRNKQLAAMGIGGAAINGASSPICGRLNDGGQVEVVVTTSDLLTTSPDATTTSTNNVANSGATSNKTNGRRGPTTIRQLELSQQRRTPSQQQQGSK